MQNPDCGSGPLRQPHGLKRNVINWSQKAARYVIVSGKTRPKSGIGIFFFFIFICVGFGHECGWEPLMQVSISQ